MVILNQSGRVLTEWSKVTRVIVTGSSGSDKREREKRGRNTCAVVAIYEGSGESAVMGVYGSDEQCIRAIGKLYYAIQEGKETFEFPQPEDLPIIKSHYGSGGGGKHGGS